MANYGYKGWIKLWREEMHNPLYSEEPFDKWHAWIDLCLLADEKGRIQTSLEALKIRWSWGSVKKVRNYLGMVQGMGWGTVRGIPNKGTQIRINTDFSAYSKSAKGQNYGTNKGTNEEIEEVYKEEGSAKPSTLSASTPLRSKENLLTEDELGDGYV